jgi:hypothetical protein
VRTARQDTQLAQHCFSSSDFGACLLQPSVAASIFILAQQLVFSLWTSGEGAGVIASAIEQEVNPQIRNRSIACIRVLRLQSDARWFKMTSWRAGD